MRKRILMPTGGTEAAPQTRRHRPTHEGFSETHAL